MSRRIRTRTKRFGHVFNEHKGWGYLVEGWGCCLCGYFTKTMDTKVNRLTCGRVTYPVLK